MLRISPALSGHQLVKTKQTIREISPSFQETMATVMADFVIIHLWGSTTNHKIQITKYKYQNSNNKQQTTNSLTMTTLKTNIKDSETLLLPLQRQIPNQ